MDERFLRYIITTKIIIDQDQWSPINKVLLHMDEISDGSLGAAESAGPYHTKLRILFSYFLIKKCLRYFSSNPNNNLNYNFYLSRT
jgi:hypothetical protein